jgi:hypothetical protein
MPPPLNTFEEGLSIIFEPSHLKKKPILRKFKLSCLQVEEKHRNQDRSTGTLGLIPGSDRIPTHEQLEPRLEFATYIVPFQRQQFAIVNCKSVQGGWCLFAIRVAMGAEDTRPNLYCFRVDCSKELS